MAQVLPPPAPVTTFGRNVDAPIAYYKEGENGTTARPAVFGKVETYNRPAEQHVVRITDVTGRESEFTLEKNGFQFIRHTSSATEEDFDNEEYVTKVYYPETEKLVKEITGATKVSLYGHRTRKSIKKEYVDGIPNHGLDTPDHRVHCDITPVAVERRVRHYFPEEAEELLKGRVQMINVWRPIGRVLREPLALADSFSVPRSDRVTVPFDVGAFIAEGALWKYNPSHRWYYKYGMGPDEVVLFKNSDSKNGGVERQVPHTSFEDPNQDESVPLRMSMEVRCLVFHPNDRD